MKVEVCPRSEELIPCSSYEHLKFDKVVTIAKYWDYSIPTEVITEWFELYGLVYQGAHMCFYMDSSQTEKITLFLLEQGEYIKFIRDIKQGEIIR